MKKILLCLMTFIAIAVYSQEAVSTAGGEATGTGGSASYTIGQAFYQTHSGVNGSVAKGVQQPYEISVVTEIKSNFAINLSVEVYPNPATTYLQLFVDGMYFTDLSYNLIDLQGRTVQTGIIVANNTIIDMGRLVPSNYFVRVFKNQNEIKTFKIVKN